MKEQQSKKHTQFNCKEQIRLAARMKLMKGHLCSTLSIDGISFCVARAAAARPTACQTRGFVV